MRTGDGLLAGSGQEVGAVWSGLAARETIAWLETRRGRCFFGLRFVLQLFVAFGFGLVKDEKGTPSEAPRSISCASVVFGVVTERPLRENDDIVVFAAAVVVVVIIFFRALALLRFT